jgi:hypothetical protein
MRLAVSGQPPVIHEKRLFATKKPRSLGRMSSSLHEERHSPSSKALSVETKRRPVFMMPLLATSKQLPLD